MNTKLIAILSTESAGSTLLSMMLAGSPSLLSPPELHILRWKKVSDWQANYPVAKHSVEEITRQLGPQHVSPGILHPDPDQSTNSYYASIIESCSQAGRILVDKTPAYALDRATLDRLESFNPFYIWLIRHPFGVAASAIARNVKKQTLNSHMLIRPKKFWRALFFERYQERVYKQRLPRWLDHWSTINRNILDFLSSINEQRYMALHFEDILTEPEEQIRKLSSALGVDYSDNMLNPWSNAPETVQWGIGSSKIHAFNQFDAARIRSWTQFYAESDLPEDVAELYRRLPSGTRQHLLES